MSFGERYLAHPALFPARLAGDAWGEESLLLELPGGPYLFTGMNDGQAAALERRWAGFVRRVDPAQAPAAAFESRTLRVGAEEFRHFDLRGFELTLEATHAADAVCLVGYEVMARLEWRRDALRGAVWTSAADPETFAGAVENYCRALVAYRLAETGAVLLHAAAVVHDGAAYLFCGPSGAGKSTLSRRCAEEGDAVLSDDLNAVAFADGRPVALPLPFCGDLRSPERRAPVPVAAVCRLRQAPVDLAEPLAPGAAIAALAACAPYVNQDPHRADGLLAQLERLVECCPTLMLSFTRTSLPWPALGAAKAGA